MEVVAAALKVAGADAIVELDEEHSSWFVRFHDSTNAVRRVDLELSHHPEFRKYRALAKQISKGNYPPFTVQKGEHRDTQPDWRSLLDHIKAEGKRDASVQRYKGLGEMNAEQLADTTMDPDKRTMLSVRVEDLVATDLIFTTLMGEDVENRRRFIEDNALDVKNLDV
jgi:DNA gyrase subunit B